MSEPESKRPKDNDFYQQRLKYWQPLFTPRNVVITFSIIGVLFTLIGILVVVESNKIVEYRVVYDGDEVKMDDCKIEKNDEGKDCTIIFNIDKDMKSPVNVYYELKGIYQNHRLYVNSRDDNQLMGKIVDNTILESNCGNRTKIGSKILNPCGAVANSLFNDIFTIVNDSPTKYELNECNISWIYDRQKFNNPENYGDSNYQWLYETYPKVVTKETGDKMSANCNGGGVKNEHFIVWMRAAALPHFRKLYGRIEQDIPAGTELKVKINANYFVKKEKAIVITTENALGGRNSFLGWSYIGVGIFCILFAIAFIIKQFTCPRKLGDIKYLKVD